MALDNKKIKIQIILETIIGFSQILIWIVKFFKFQICFNTFRKKNFETLNN